MMRRSEPPGGTYDMVRSSEPHPEYHADNDDDDAFDGANSVLAPPSSSNSMDPDEGFGIRSAGRTPPHYRRIGANSARDFRSFFPGRRSCGTSCWLLGIFLVTAAVTVTWVWSSSGDGASNLLLQLRYATTSSSQLPEGPDEELIATPRPYLQQLIADFHANVTGNVSWLLDFAVIGHSKCSTTSHLKWLRRHPEILMHEHEVYALSRGQPAEMVSMLYALPNRPNRKRGYKNPTDIMNPRALDNLRTYWPNTRIIVGVRHPVKWFESFYNFHKRKADDHGRPNEFHMGPAETMDVPGIAYFHTHLSLLGKTNVSNPAEAALLGDSASTVQPPPMSNKVFLYESTQPYDLHNGRSARYRYDLQSFLGLTQPLGSIMFQGEVDGDTYNYSSKNFHYDIDICEAKFAELRHRLIEVGTVAAEWILTYFVPNPDVTVSSPDHFEELLLSWSLDPCEGE